MRPKLAFAKPRLHQYSARPGFESYCCFCKKHSHRSWRGRVVEYQVINLYPKFGSPKFDPWCTTWDFWGNFYRLKFKSQFFKVTWVTWISTWDASRMLLIPIASYPGLGPRPQTLDHKIHQKGMIMSITVVSSAVILKKSSILSFIPIVEGGQLTIMV